MGYIVLPPLPNVSHMVWIIIAVFLIFAVTMASKGNIHWLDFLILSAMLVVSCIIGIYYACKKQNQAEYLMGNRQMKWWAVTLSLVVTFYRGISQIGQPAEIYLYGIQLSLALLGLAAAMIFATFTFVPMLFRLELTSSYEVNDTVKISICILHKLLI